MSLALYRTYRPGRLAEVIGQDHVTLPLGRALDSGRAHHAYLFTGPRGCGKTSTARILARSLNCEHGPTSDPCGTCQSCQDLAPNGPGSIDVLELDAASHRGIDEARELRDKAMYAPASSRYKVYIIDEAHQLTDAAANAMLKLIEEPPPHVRFVFATTEPDKILATIRSRTHHYPFRLVTLRRLQEHLAWVCEQEGVPAEAPALALVARAGAGSVRDALSVLGQLVAGSGPDGVTYVDAVIQLGFTDASLLDESMDALVEADGAALFAVVDRVVDGGLDPRRFATDLLERLRDLLVISQVPGAAEAGLLDVPDTTMAALSRQAAGLSLAQLSRAADLVSSGLSELKGTTAPRLQLELLAARLLLPAADDSDVGVLARLDRVERRLAFVGEAVAVDHPSPTAAAAAVVSAVHEAPVAATDRPLVVGPPVRPHTSAPPARRTATGEGPPAPPKLSTIAPSSAPSALPPTADSDSDSAAAATELAAVAAQNAETKSAPPVQVDPAAAAPTAAEPTAAEPTAAAPADTSAFRAQWPAVLEALKSRSRVAFTLAEGTVPIGLTGSQLALGHPDPTRMDYLRRNAGHLGQLTLAVLDITGQDVELDIVLSDAARKSAPVTAAPEPVVVVESGPSPRERAALAAADAPAYAEPTNDEATPDDLDDADAILTGLALVQRELGGSVLGEFDQQPRR